jgi:hypothetical protein
VSSPNIEHDIARLRAMREKLSTRKSANREARAFAEFNPTAESDASPEAPPTHMWTAPSLQGVFAVL